MNCDRRTWIDNLVYAGMALAVIVPVSFGKYLFLLDFVPRLNEFKVLEQFYGFTAPVYGGGLPVSLISVLIPPWIFQKVLLFTILFLSGYSMHKLVSTFTQSKTARFYAGLLYMLNPYTYIRTVVGHWGILLAYAILPLAIKYFLELLDKRDSRSIMKAVLITTIVAFNAHTFFMAFLVFSILFLFRVYREKSATGLIKPLAVFFTLFLALDTYWLIPLITAQRTTVLTHISTEDLAAFAPRIESFSALFTLASMHGFWRAGYLYAKDFLPFWWVFFVFILFLAVHGFVSCFRNERLWVYVRAFGLIWLAGLILATGIRSPFEGFFRFLFDHIPLMKGMRDTHKFVTMLALSYSFLGALGVAEIERGLEGLKKENGVKLRKAAIVILFVPLVYSFTFFNGFAGQIKPADFPKDWYEVNEFLNKDKDDFRVLFLPWHLYMDFHWVPNKDKRIANPAPLFFDKAVISAKNIEVSGIYRQIYSPSQLYIDQILSKRNGITNFGELVSILGVKYILLTKEVDYKSYFFLFNQSDLKLVLETENFYVFENKQFKGRIFSVAGTAYVRNWDELIKRSKMEDLTTRLYVIGSGEEENFETYRKLEYEKVSPVKYDIRDKPLKYVVFTEEYSKDWKLDGREPVKAYGVVNAYAVSDISESKEVVYERFYRVCLPSYIASLITFIGCAGYMLRGWKIARKGRVR
ncbi:alpha-(1-_3)-arabinofuranosyltransferase domain-containing protein [Geoglobus acetivorans]